MVFAVTFLAMLLISFTLIAVLTRPTEWEKAVKQRVGDIHQARHLDKARKRDAERILKTDTHSSFSWLDRFLQRYRFAVDYKALAMHAGSDWTIGAFAMYSACAGVSAFVGLYLFFPAPLLDVVLGMVGLCAPYMLLKHRRTKRLQAFNNALPDAIDMMARALRAGHSLSSAIEVLSEQAGEAVAVEFAVVFRQQNFGLPLRDALLQMADRVLSKDLRFLVTAMLVQKETGGNLTEILDRATHVIRERIRIEGEVRVHTAQGRLTGWILSLLPFVMLFLLNLVNPGYSHVLLHDPTGQKLLYIGAGMIAIGTFFIRRIVDIQV